MIGSKLGPYEITAAIGAGGMGEVYRATDTTLEREVAIKVLPQAFVEDKERLARFELWRIPCEPDARRGSLCSSEPTERRDG